MNYLYKDNQLTRVEEAGGWHPGHDLNGFKDVNSAVGVEEYEYDDNSLSRTLVESNMFLDNNKGISSISYNHLNLPEHVVLDNGTIVVYLYDAAELVPDIIRDIKLQKTSESGGNATVTDYVAGGPASRKHYVNGTLSFMQHAEGRTLYDAGAFNYEYNLTDHLGNVRVSVDQSGTVVQKDDYYPFGLTFNSWTDVIPESLYKYNGKEEQKEWGVIDYGARMYQADLGRFFNQDRFSEKYYDLSPYQYVANNPIKHIDINGDSIIAVVVNDKSGFIHGDKTLYIDHTIYDDVVQILWSAAATKTHIRINSSFRTNVRQQGLQNDPDATTPASPGNSPHNAGVGIDFNLYTDNEYKGDDNTNVDLGNSQVTNDNPLIDALLNDPWISDGWRWGGDFNAKDPIHMDKRPPNQADFNVLRDANQTQMNGSQERDINESYISRFENVTIGGKSQRAQRKLRRMAIRSDLRSIKRLLKGTK